jgi:hypothetical protein
LSRLRFRVERALRKTRGKSKLKNFLIAALALIFVSGAPFRPDTAGADTTVQEPQGTDQPAPLGIPLGASRAQVEAAFAAAKIPQLSSEGRNEIYREPPAKIANAGQVLLSFYQDRLARIICLIDVESQEAEPYVRRYQELKQALSEKYGRPYKNREYLAPDYEAHPLLALQTGKAVYGSVWKTGNLQISLMLSGDNFRVTFALSYDYLPLSEPLDRERKQEEKGKL